MLWARVALSRQSPDESAGGDLAWRSCLSCRAGCRGGGARRRTEIPWQPTLEPDGASSALSCGSAGTEGGRKEVWLKLPSDWHDEPSLGPHSTTRR